MAAVVILIEGWDPVANAAVSLYAGSHDDPAVCHLNGWTFWPAIAKLPTLRYDLFDGDFAGQITAPSSSLTLRTEPWPNFGRYKLADARIRLWTGNVGDAWANWALRFDGKLTSQPTIRDGAAEVAFAVDDRWLDTALLPTYAGTTGAEGSAAFKGQVKPLAIGAPRYVSGTLIDSVNSVFQVSAFAVNGVEAALEKLARFGASRSDYGSYAALIAAALPAGTWATANALGLVRFGAPPAGQISFLLQGDVAGPDGWVRRPGRVIRRLALLAGGAGKIDDASLTALDVARPYNVSIYVDQQTTARELIQNLAASLNCVAGVSWTGQLFVAPVAIGTADVTLAADGSSMPPVASVQQLEQASPYQKLAMTAERAWTVHALADIAFTATVVDVGAYAAGTTYREGNVVGLSDGSRYLYTSTTPTAGNTPPNTTYWSQLAAASVVDYANVGGTTRPENNATLGATLGATGGGNVKKSAGGLWLEPDLNTSVGTAAAISGQAWAATNGSQSKVDNQYVPTGSNSVINSGFKRSVFGFNIVNGGGFTSGLNLVADYAGQRQVAGTTYGGTLPSGNSQDCWTTLSPWSSSNLPGSPLDQMKKFCLPVAVGDRVFGRVLAARHRCLFQLFALFFRADGSFAIGPLLAQAGRLQGGTGGNPANFDPCGNYYDVTDTSLAYMGLMVRMIGTGEANPYIFWTEPMMGKLVPGQSILPSYIDGPNDPIADQTSANTAAAIVGQGVLATKDQATAALIAPSAVQSVTYQVLANAVNCAVGN